MSSEFLLVSTPEWHEIPNATALIDAIGEAGIIAIVNSKQEYPVLDGLFEHANVVPAGYGITDAFLINTGGVYESRLRMWIQYAPIVYAN